MNKILLSTDIGSDIDDALSLQIMLNHPEIDLEAVYTVNGKVDCRCFIVHYMLQQHGMNIPIIRGYEKPMAALTPPYYHFEDLLVRDDYVDEKRMEKEMSPDVLFYPVKKFKIIVEDAATEMARRLKKGKHVIFSIAPMTILGKLIQDYPEAIANIERLYIMGFNMFSGQMEHNIRHDPKAAQLVLESDIPITVIPIELCDRFLLPLKMAEQLKQSKSGEYVYYMLMAFAGGQLVREMRAEFSWLLDYLLKEVRISIKSTEIMSKDRYEYLHNFKHMYLINFDEFSAYMDENFWRDYYRLIENLRDPQNCYIDGEKFSSLLEKIVLKRFSMADVYVPYCYLHADKLKTQRKLIQCDMQGNTYLLPGDKHEMVYDLDFEHFRAFVRQWLR